MHWWYDDPAPQPRARAGADTRLARLAAVALLDDPLITGGLVEVSVQNGVIILDGDVDTEESRLAAVTRAWSVPGVRDVCDALEIIEVR